MFTYLRTMMAVFVLCSICMVSECNAMAAPRAIWIWESDTYRMLDKDDLQQQVETFFDKQHISTMYLYADEFQGRNILVNEPLKYYKFIANAHARGFKVYALLGSSYLHTHEYILPERRAIALRMFENILIFNKNSPDAHSRFDGVNIDIEPYLLGDWSVARSLRGQQYLDLSAAFMRMKQAYGSTLDVGPAMPFWYDGITDVAWQGKHRKLNEFVQDIYDYVAIMDYRNVALGSDSIVSLASDELNYADKNHKKVMIGVETLKTSPAKLTFYGTGIRYFNAQLALAESALSKHPSFGGFVVHHLTSYLLLVTAGKDRDKNE